MAKTRSFALHICMNVVVGVVVRVASASDVIPLTLLVGDQNAFSMYFDVFRVILFLGILVGLVNFLARAASRGSLDLGSPSLHIFKPAAYGLVAGFFVLFSMTPLPSFPMLVLAALFGSMAWTSYQKTQLMESRANDTDLEQQELMQAIPRESILRLELGSALLSLVSPEMQGSLIEKMASLRATIAEDLGLTIPSIRIKDDLQLPANTYRIYLRGGIVGEGVVYKDRFMVVVDDDDGVHIRGIREQEPVFGLSAIWVTEEVRDSMGALFLQAMDPVTVVMTHLSNIVEKHASELLSREEVSVMVDELHATSPRLVDEVIGKTVTLSRLHHILIALLEELVPVKDLSTILETASDGCELSVEECVEQVRCTLRRQICANVSTTGFGGQQVIRCVELPANVEAAITNHCISIEELSTALQNAAGPLIAEGLPIVVVSSNATRRQVRAQVGCSKEGVVVLSRSEIVPEVDLQIVGSVEPPIHIRSSTSVAGFQEDKRQTIAYAKSLLGNERVVSATERIEFGIAEIRTLVGEVLEHESAGRLSPVLARAQHALIKQGVEADLATNIVQSLHSNPQLQDDELRSILIDELLRRLPRTLPPPQRDSSGPNIIALVGPTGVGKTTTIAKLAARFHLQQGKSVAFVTADTYRIAAVDQLKQYADLFDAKLEIAGTAVQMKEAIASCANTDVILIDTAGRSAEDGDRIRETADILCAARPTQTHLVLSAATSMTASQRAVERFSQTGYDRVIVTKLDEIVTIGEIVSTLCEIDTPISWFTDGQDVASHIDLARSTRLIDLLFANDR